MLSCSKETSELIFYVNGQKIIESRPCPRTFLVTYLRETLNLRGTKVACGEGGCGSCTVMVSRFDRKTSVIKHEARYACMTPICALHGLSVITVEALGSTRTHLHKLQKSLVDGHGVQCGFCTPGMLMSMYALLRNNSKPNDFDIENALRGNLCRCTGYRPILESFKMGTKDLQFNCPLGEKCCKNMSLNHNDKEAHLHDISKDEMVGKDFIFPNELQLTDRYDKQNLTFCANDISWLSPRSKDELLTLKNIHPSSQVIAGGNIMAYKLKRVPPQTPQILISITRIREFYEVFINEEGITLFPNVTISDLESVVRKFKWAGSKPHFIDSLLEMCQRIASVQIRNTSTVCGGLAQGFHGSDLNVLLLVADCKVTFLSYESERLLNVNVELLSSKPQLRSNEIISRLFIPFHNNKNKFFGFYKLSPRKDFSRAILNSGFSVEFDGTAACHVVNAIFIYGGQFTKPLVMSQLGTYILRKSWRKELLPGCLGEIEKDFKVLKNQGSISGSDDDLSYILFSMQGLFVKFFVKLLLKLSKSFPELDSPDDDITSAAFWEDNRNCDLHSGTQVYNSDRSKCSVHDLGKPLPHRWANQSTTGEAVFIDDQRICKGELCLSIVKSSKAHANILNVDYSEALKMPGVVDYIDHTSVQGSNIFQVFSPMELFVSKEATYVGQPIGAVLAQTHEQARLACSLVRVEYDELPSIISIEDAIKHNSFHHVMGGGVMNRGDSEKAFQELCEEVLENEISIGGQEHFYMETHCCRVVPLMEDGGELEVFAGSQYSDGLQKIVSQTVNLPQNKVNIRVKRMGGSFGGKELSTYLTVLPCAVAALKFNLPVRCMLTRRDDMQMTGNRRPYKATYKVGFTKEGVIKALNLKMYSNDGVTPDWTILMGVTLLNCDNVYKIPNISASGSCCKTNLPPCTAMRGAGSPQAIIVAESIISDIAIHLDKPAHEIRELNMYETGCLSLANSPVDENLHKCYNEVKLQSSFIELCQKVQHFNSENKYVKRAVSLLPIKFSPCFPPFMNKGAAFLNIYKDGTVLLSHGGVECGQGLHTKMIQVASRALGIPASYIRIGETSTSIIPNAQVTGGSTGSDMNGMAVVDACEQINERLKSIKESNPSKSWEDVVSHALEQKINLSAFGFWNGAYNEEYDWQSGKGRAHSYYTYGAIVAYVEVDCLTGNHVVLQVDVVMDVGKSLNPAIDVGQIEGGIVMGLGMCLLEEHKYSADGSLESAGPDKYHIPTISNIPLKMNVTLLKNSGNDKAVYSSKGIGEPPLLLSTSVWLAIKEVVAGMRKKHDGAAAAAGSNVFMFNTPATPKHVILACNPRKI